VSRQPRYRPPSCVLYELCGRGRFRFRTSWGKAFEKADLGDLHFHDLRGTAVTRLTLAGCTVPEIAASTGYSMETVQQILDAHYLGGRLELAESAIKKLNVAYG
jgi:hypothetical protein